MKAYIATKLERWQDHRSLRDELAAEGIELSYDWTIHGPVWSEGAERIKEVSCLEMEGVAKADVVIVLLPGGRGTHAELGMALAMGTPVILHADWFDAKRFFKAHPDTCAFYHHPLCHWQVGSWDELARYAKGVVEARSEAVPA